jgi:hypothetical protein
VSDCGAVAQLVPSTEFSALSGEPDAQGRLRFSASTEANAADRRASYRLTARQLPQRILTRLAGLEGTGAPL